MRPRTFITLAASVLLALPLLSASALAWPARLDHVADGDTITVVNANTGDRVRVRLEGIDAPEINHGRGRPGQPYGYKAKAYLEHLLAGATIAVHPNGTTSYDRIVAWVSADGRNVAIALVRAGLAWDYPHYDRAHRYTKAERYAEGHDLGLWNQPHPIPPWDWRHHHWH